jgi:hypothetical protein
VKKRRLALALAGLAVVTLLPAAPALAAAKPTASASTITPPPGIKFDPGKAKCTTVKAASGDVEHCRQAERLPLKDLTTTQRAQRQQMMTKLATQGKKQSPATPSASATPAATAVSGPPAECGFSDTTFPPTYVASPSRFLSCSDGLWTVFDYEVINGAFSLVGNFDFEDQSWVTFSATSTSWVHDMRTLTYTGEGTLDAGVVGYLASNCFLAPTVCTATNTIGPDPQSVYLAPESSYDSEWNEQDAGPAATISGSIDNLDADLGVAWDLSAGTQPWDTQETGNLHGRCDNGVAYANKGCVNENYTDTLYLSYAEDGSSADMINFAEWNLPPYYGNQYSPTPTPLHRLQDPILIGDGNSEGNNREVICGDGSFTKDSAITAALAPYDIPPNYQETDSCDEYPFNATYESGAMVDGADGNPKPYVTTGADCLQVTAIHTGTQGDDEAADWSTVTKPDPGNQPCIRGHIPNLLNGHVGSEYSAFTRASRVIDKDPFWVFVTP